MGGGDFGGRLVGQFELEAVKEQRQLRLRLGVAAQLQFAPVGGGDANVDHLNGGEFVEQTARGQAGGERFQAAAESDVQTIGEKGDEDVRLDAPGLLMVDRADGEVALQGSKRLLYLDQLDVVAPQGGGIALG